MNKKISFPIAVIIIAALAGVVVGLVAISSNLENIISNSTPQTSNLVSTTAPTTTPAQTPIVTSTPTPASTPSVVFSDNCDILQRQINDLIETANYCTVDSDCLISTEVAKTCLCWSLINKNANLSKIKEGDEKYIQLGCPAVICKPCADAPKIGNVKCRNNKCVDIKLSNP